MIGESQRHEFQTFVDWIRTSRSVHVPTLMEALQRLQSIKQPPSTVYWLQSYPSQHTVSDVDTLRRATITSKMVCIFGGFCEGETRTGQPMSEMPRHAWHAWQPDLCPTNREATAGAAPVVGIATANAEVFELLSEACQSWRYSVARWDQDDDPAAHDVLLWEDSADRRQRPINGSHLIAQHPGTPIVGVVGFPRIQMMKALSEGRLAALLPKPFVLQHLRYQLDRLCRHEDAERTVAD